MELILMRHGTTQGNLERRFIGTLDVPLLPQGEELARRVGATLPAVEHIYRSPLQRCRRTAELLWPGVEMTVVDELRESDFGPFEGKNHEELKDDPLKPSRRVAAFQKRLESHGITATVRRKLGGDIDASCGQLRRKTMQQEHT